MVVRCVALLRCVVHGLKGGGPHFMMHVHAQGKGNRRRSVNQVRKKIPRGTFRRQFERRNFHPPAARLLSRGSPFSTPPPPPLRWGARVTTPHTNEFFTTLKSQNVTETTPGVALPGALLSQEEGSVHLSRQPSLPSTVPRLLPLVIIGGFWMFGVISWGCFDSNLHFDNEKRAGGAYHKPSPDPPSGGPGGQGVGERVGGAFYPT